MKGFFKKMRTIANKRQAKDKYSDWNILDCVDFSEKYTKMDKESAEKPLTFIEYVESSEKKMDILKCLKIILRIKK